MLFHPEFTELESTATYSSNCNQTTTSTSIGPSYPFRNQGVTLKDSYAMFAGGSGGSSVVGAGSSSGGLTVPALPSNVIVSPSPTRTAIKEANDHLQLLHQRVQELERTVREQAEALIKKDECMQTRLREVTHTKDRRIAELSRALDQSGEQIQRLEQACRDRDAHIEEATRRNAEELGSYVPVLERLVTSLRKSSSSSGRSWATNHAVCNHVVDLIDQTSASGNDQHFLPGSRGASPSVVKPPLGYVTTGTVPTNHRARKLFKGSANSVAARQDFRFHSNCVDPGGERPTSSSSACHAVPPDMRIGRSFNINSNFSMSEDDDYDANVEDDVHKYS